jgi:hypothetical protein
MKRTFLKIAVLIFFLLGLILTVVHNVSKRVTVTDKVVISNLTDSLNINRELLRQDYNYQIRTIEKIQEQVLNIIEPSSTGIPLGEEREPENVINIGAGQCFDRSRLLEKIFIFYGFKTRHLSIYFDSVKISALKRLLGGNVSSHATTEVKTIKGWLIVDSNSNWISYDRIFQPMSFANLDNQLLKNQPDETLNSFYLKNSTAVYGLYSRHGQFYPPFNKIPDYNIRELFYNFGF